MQGRAHPPSLRSPGLPEPTERVRVRGVHILTPHPVGSAGLLPAASALRPWLVWRAGRACS